MIRLVHAYDPMLFAGSLVIPVFAGYVVLRLMDRVQTVGGAGRSLAWLTAASGALGVGIWTMHLTGMLALRLPVDVAYEWGFTLLSMAIASVVSLLALGVFRRKTVPPLGWSVPPFWRERQSAGCTTRGWPQCSFRARRPIGSLRWQPRSS